MTVTGDCGRWNRTLPETNQGPETGDKARNFILKGRRVFDQLGKSQDHSVFRIIRPGESVGRQLMKGL